MAVKRNGSEACDYATEARGGGGELQRRWRSRRADDGVVRRDAGT